MANSSPLQLQWRKNIAIKRLGLMGGYEGGDTTLSHPFHEQFESAHNCSEYYVHLIKGVKDMLMQHASKSALSTSQETGLL